MKKRTITGIGLAVAFGLTLIFSPQAASATEPDPTPAEFVPYAAERRWIIPESWPFEQEPSYQPAIFPQAAGDVIPCGQWAQDDTYWIESLEDEAILNGLGDTLNQGDDSAIYASHVFTPGEACAPPVEEPPVEEPPVVVVPQPEPPVVETLPEPEVILEVETLAEPEDVLAETGSTPLTWLYASLGGLFLAGGAALLGLRRRATV